MSGRALGVCVALVAALLVAGPAQASDPNSQFDQPALGQYIETLPGGGGPTAPSVGHGHRGGAAPLSARARANLLRQGGSLRGPLEQLASSRDLGAPPARKGGSGLHPAHRAGGHAPNEDGKSFMNALSDAATQGDAGGSWLWLLLALLGVSAAVVALAIRNRRQPGRPAA